MDRPKRLEKQKPTYDPAQILTQWLSSLPADRRAQWDSRGVTSASLAAYLPRRFTVYEPLVLFSPGALSGDSWARVLSEATDEEKERLWRGILEAVGRAQRVRVTHLAVNAAIPAHLSEEAGENVLRSPVSLVGLHGDFGPAVVPRHPSEADFGEAFWVGTKQNGIWQTWAPRHTMFSRGNVTEKARILTFHDDPPTGLESRKRSVKGGWAVDLYAGIGYFSFSYRRLGMRVLCWEINPWSVEGLRRGAARNGWSVRVVQGEDLDRPADELVGDEQIVVFLEDNRHALGRIERLKRTRAGVDILHVNGGLLPTSKGSWEHAWKMAATSDECWLHLHENVEEADIPARRREIQELFNRWAEADGPKRDATLEHVQRVKTIAPRVWHCVFDVYIKMSSQ